VSRILVLPGVSSLLFAPDNLPIKRVVLYKNGVGSFGHVGSGERQTGCHDSICVGAAQRCSEVADGAGYTQQLNDQEKQLATLQKESGELPAQAQSAQAALHEMIRQLSIDVRL